MQRLFHILFFFGLLFGFLSNPIAQTIDYNSVIEAQGVTTQIQDNTLVISSIQKQKYGYAPRQPTFLTTTQKMVPETN